MIARRFLRLSLALLVSLIALMAIGTTLNPTAYAARTAVHLYPDNAPPCNTTLQFCIDNSAPGDVIQIKPGVYVTSVTILKPVSLIGLGTITPTILIALPNQRVMTITSVVITASTVISNLQISGGRLSGTDCLSDACGGGILVTGGARPTLARLTIENNSAYQGGGLWADAGPEVVIADSKFVSNSASHAGGGIYSASSVRLINVLVERNHAGDNGGGLDVQGALYMSNGSIVSNTASIGGGGARVASAATLNFGRWEGNFANGSQGGGLFASQLTMTGTLFINNEGKGGGGAYVNGPAVLKDGRFEQNRATAFGNGGGLQASELVVGGTHFIGNTSNGSSVDSGGGIYVSPGGADLNLVRFEANATRGSGGGLWVSGPVTLTNATVLNNIADMGNGGGVYGANTLLIKDSRLENNLSQLNSGGGAYAQGQAQIGNTTFVSNSASLRGGGLAVRAGVDVQNSQFFHNLGGQSGGGLDVEGPLAITSSLFISNTSTLGGGVFHNLTGDGRVINSLFARNVGSATGASALHLASTGHVDVIHTTIADPTWVVPDYNPAPAIQLETGSLNVTNTIISDHSIGILNNSGTAFEDYNLFHSVGNIASGLVTPGGHDQYPAAAPYINPLTDNYHLQAGLDAIDNGTDAGIHFDIDGQPRPIGPGYDIGYDEFGFSIQLEIDKTAPGGTVFIPSGEYTESLTLAKPVSLIGLGATPPIVHAVFNQRVITITGPAITASTVISNLQFAGGDLLTMCTGECRGGGALITNFARPQMVNVSLHDNAAMMGGGLYVQSGGAQLTNVQLSRNHAGQSGGGLYIESAGTVVEHVGGGLDSNLAIDGAGVFVQDGRYHSNGASVFFNTADSSGGGLIVGGTGVAVIEGANVSYNQAAVGGGVFVGMGSGEILNSTLFSNTANLGGGVYLAQPTSILTLTNGQIDSNRAITAGGGVYVANGVAYFNSGAIRANTADQGGGVYLSNGVVKQQALAHVLDNSASSGGGAFLGLPTSRYYQFGGTFNGNQALYGGGVLVQDGAAWLDGTLISNTATYRGGAVLVQAGQVVQTGQIMSNVAWFGGGVYVGSSAAFFTQAQSGLLRWNKTVNGPGGGVYVENGNAALEGQIIDNVADTYGGGIAVGGAGSVKLGGLWRVAGNLAIGNLGGGGLFVQTGGHATLVGGRMESNTAANFGGGLYTASGLVVTGTRFFNNYATDGGAIYHTGTAGGQIVNVFVAGGGSPAGNIDVASVRLNSTGDVSVAHATFGNAADTAANITGSALVASAGYVKVVNSIVASYSIGISTTAGTVYEDYNLFFGTPLSLTGIITSGGHSRSGLDPEFINPVLGDYHLRPTSPAINHGLNVGVQRDIDFDARPIGGGFDVGADETLGAGIVITPGGNVTTTLNYTGTNGGSTNVLIPPSALSGTISGTVSVYYSTISTASITAPLPSRLFLSGDPFELDAFSGDEFTATQIITFSAPVTISIHYTETELGGISEQTLKLYRLEYPPFGAGWCAIGVCRPNESQTLDTVNNIITATVYGFSKWGKLGANYPYDLFLPVILR